MLIKRLWLFGPCSVLFKSSPLAGEQRESWPISSSFTKQRQKDTKQEIGPTPTRQQIFQLPGAKCTVHCPVTWICQFSTSKAAISTSLLCGCHSSRPQALPGSLFPEEGHGPARQTGTCPLIKHAVLALDVSCLWDAFLGLRLLMFTFHKWAVEQIYTRASLS